jgi:hypothetical protein
MLNHIWLESSVPTEEKSIIDSQLRIDRREIFFILEISINILQ